MPTQHGNTREEVAVERAAILQNTDLAIRVFKTIFYRQQPEERKTGQHQGHDGKGFRPHETVTLNALFHELSSYAWRLTPAQADDVRERMSHYADQFIAAVKAGEEFVPFTERRGRSKKAARQRARGEAEARGITYSESYLAARGGEGEVSRPKKLTEEEKAARWAALEKMEGG